MCPPHGIICPWQPGRGPAPSSQRLGFPLPREGVSPGTSSRVGLCAPSVLPGVLRGPQPGPGSWGDGLSHRSGAGRVAGAIHGPRSQAVQERGPWGQVGPSLRPFPRVMTSLPSDLAAVCPREAIVSGCRPCRDVLRAPGVCVCGGGCGRAPHPRLQAWLHQSRASSSLSSSRSVLKGHLLREALPGSLGKTEPAPSLSNPDLVLFFCKAVIATWHLNIRV